jgi:hypothetical protein
MLAVSSTTALEYGTSCRPHNSETIDISSGMSEDDMIKQALAQSLQPTIRAAPLLDAVPIIVEDDAELAAAIAMSLADPSVR